MKSRAGEVDRRLEHALRAHRALIRPQQIGVQRVERLEGLVLTGEQLHDRDAAQVLIQICVHPREPDPNGAERVPHHAPEVRGERDDHRQGREGHEREAPVQDEHRRRDANEHEDVAEDRDDSTLDHVDQRVDVVRDPRHQPPDGVAVEEPEREELEMAEQLEPQVVHRPLTDPGREQ